ncbi:MAG: antibiotic biosynthesis monooxygenase [Actinobacteria bacterium]|nr:antibiotic biosynthesis monooxygenase [Actinomycetota bacterium]
MTTSDEQRQILTVFRNRLRPDNVEQYRVTSARMDALARSMPGFVDAKTFTADDGERVTIVTFADAESQRAWREHPEHREAQRAGVEEFYSEYSIQVAAVAYRHDFAHGPSTASDD